MRGKLTMRKVSMAYSLKLFIASPRPCEAPNDIETH